MDQTIVKLNLQQPYKIIYIYLILKNKIGSKLLPPIYLNSFNK